MFRFGDRWEGEEGNRQVGLASLACLWYGRICRQDGEGESF